MSTPIDLAALERALLGGRLLKPAQLAEMQRTVPAPGFDAAGTWGYGLGLARTKVSCGGYA